MIGTESMRNIITISMLLIGAAGCHGEFEIRKEPDLWQVTPQQAKHLGTPQLDSRYAPEVTDRSSWQIHTSLTGRDALTDGDAATVATSQDEHRLGEFILIDLGCTCHFQTVRQLHPASVVSPPRFRIDTAGEHGFPYTLQFLGTGQSNESNAIFTRPVNARFIKITIIEDSREPWGVSELVVE